MIDSRSRPVPATVVLMAPLDGWRIAVATITDRPQYQLLEGSPGAGPFLLDTMCMDLFAPPIWLQLVMAPVKMS